MVNEIRKPEGGILFQGGFYSTPTVYIRGNFMLGRSPLGEFLPYARFVLFFRVGGGGVDATISVFRMIPYKPRSRVAAGVAR
jgi:hypothetical protein